MLWKIYIISWIQWDYLDLSTNMINNIEKCNLLFVEEIVVFNRLINENKIDFHWELIELNRNFALNKSKKQILEYIVSWKNIWIFESSWTACFIDPWYEIVDYLYKLKNKIDFDIVPVPWTSALTLAISCSWFNIVNFQFLWFISSDTKEEVIKAKITSIYFNQFTSLEELNKCISFMDRELNRLAFIWINLWKKWLNRSNLIIRWTYREVYEKLNDIYMEKEKLDDITFIFN